MTGLPTDEHHEDQAPLEKEMSREDVDSMYRDEIRDLQRDSDIHGLGRRITIIAILIPCLLCAILVFAYLDMRERISQLETKGSRDVKVLSEDVLDKMASLTGQYAKIEKSLAVGLSALKKSSTFVEKRLKSNQEKIKQLTTSKVDNETFEQARKKRSEEVAHTFAVLQKDVAKEREYFEKLATELDKKIDKESNSLAALRSDMEKQGNELAKGLQVIEVMGVESEKQASLINYLSENMEDKGELRTLIESRLADYEERLALFEKQIKSLKGEISHLEEHFGLGPTGRAQSAAQSPESKDKPVDKTTTSTAVPVPGKVIEQDITE